MPRLSVSLSSSLFLSHRSLFVFCFWCLFFGRQSSSNLHAHVIGLRCLYEMLFFYPCLFLFLSLIFIRLFIGSFSFASLFKEKKQQQQQQLWLRCAMKFLFFGNDWLGAGGRGSQLNALRKPGERPNGRTDGFDRALLLNDVDIVVVGNWSSESELPGVVLIIIDVNTSSLSSISCRWREEKMNRRTSIEETTRYFSIVALFDSTWFIRFISIIIIDRLNKHGWTFQNVRIKRKEWVEEMRW